MDLFIPNEQPEKRSVTIAGHRTSLSLEPSFWKDLKKTADERNMSLSAFIAAIDDTRPETTNLSSAIRLFLYHDIKQSK
jgi:predicted DNA-binding ribbon-helix-helix protein